MNDQLSAALGRVLDELERTGIPYMIVGSVAGMLHGQMRSTMDVDLVIDPSPRSLEDFLASLPAEEFYVSPDAAREAFAQRSQFNLVDFATGFKIDLLVRKDRAFSKEEFARRESVPAFDRRVSTATVEDVVLAKLEWAKAGGSQRQVEDVRQLLRIAGPRLDREYLRHWAEQLGIADELEALLEP